MARTEYMKVENNAVVARKFIGGKPVFDSSGDKGEWRPVERQAKPTYDPATQKLEQTETIRADKVVFGWRVQALSANEKRQTVEPLADLVRVLLANNVIKKSDLKSNLGR